MKHLLIVLLTSLLSISADAQKAYTTSRDEETGALVFKGPLSLSDLREEPSFGWFRRGEAAYKPDSAALKFLRKELPAYTVVVILGTWCDDSHNLVPKLTRTLEAAGFPMSQYVLYGADRNKQTGGIESKLYDVRLVPTIILFKGNVEAGRIVESARRNIETDLVQIISRQAADR